MPARGDDPELPAVQLRRIGVEQHPEAAEIDEGDAGEVNIDRGDAASQIAQTGGEAWGAGEVEFADQLNEQGVRPRGRRSRASVA